jgi:hypothetical protein
MPLRARDSAQRGSAAAAVLIGGDAPFVSPVMFRIDRATVAVSLAGSAVARGVAVANDSAKSFHEAETRMQHAHATVMT